MLIFLALFFFSKTIGFHQIEHSARKGNNVNSLESFCRSDCRAMSAAIVDCRSPNGHNRRQFGLSPPFQIVAWTICPVHFYVFVTHKLETHTICTFCNQNACPVAGLPRVGPRTAPERSLLTKMIETSMTMTLSCVRAHRTTHVRVKFRLRRARNRGWYQKSVAIRGN